MTIFTRAGKLCATMVLTLGLASCGGAPEPAQEVTLEPQAQAENGREAAAADRAGKAPPATPQLCGPRLCTVVCEGIPGCTQSPIPGCGGECSSTFANNLCASLGSQSSTRRSWCFPGACC